MKNDKRLYIVATITAKPEFSEDLKNLLLSLVGPTLKEEGCVFYDLHVDRANSEVFYFMECWENQKSLDAHTSSSHVQRLLSVSDKITTSIELKFMHRI